MNDLKNDYVVSYLTLRQMIGWAGLLMPLVVRGGAYILEGIHTGDSISAYYYTGMRDVFVSTLVLVGALLACYRTPSLSDNIVATICGVAAVGIGLFPMDPYYGPEILEKYSQAASKFCYVNHGILGVHYVFVGVFFALTFYLVYFRFSAFTPGRATPQKLMRNRIYKICGIVMAVSFLAIGAIALLAHGSAIFWPETAAVGAFAIAWLVKGQTVLKDAHPVSVPLAPVVES